MNRSWLSTVGLLSLGLSACSGEGPSTVPPEPLQVSGGQFISGPLPGTLPGVPAKVPANTLAVTSISVQPRPFFAGAVGQPISGLVTSDATAIGVEFADMGTGYWIVPVGSPDTQNPGQSDFSFTANVNPGDPPGTHQLRVVGISARGQAGPQSEGAICIETAVPDNLHECVPSKAPPAVVISLTWDTTFNLDLHVRFPDGADVGPESPADPLLDAAVPPQLDVHTPFNCVAGAGEPREDLVFQDPPAPGTYEIRVDPFASCGQPAAHFTVTVYVSEPAAACAACRNQPSAASCTGCQLVAVFSQTGELIASQVTGGASPGLFIQSQTF